MSDKDLDLSLENKDLHTTGADHKHMVAQSLMQCLTEEDLDTLEEALQEDGTFDFTKLPDSLMSLIVGYIDYAKEVIINRALPDIDGLKPVHRRILWAMHIAKIKNLRKCARIAGDTLQFHPHGESSVYDALVRLTDECGALQIPLIKGHGSFGKVYNTDKPADKRYTEASLHDNAKEFFFNEVDGVDFVPNFDGETTEPTLLMASFPIILCNPTQGIAVGFSCSLPSFNFNDVIDLAVEYGETGRCTKVICPDFPTGGYYVKNDRELAKIMHTGKGKIKLRGRVEVQDKSINIIEFPYGNTIQGILKQINDKDIQWVKTASDLDDFKRGASLKVTCTSKARVDEVLLSLYRDTGLQDTFGVDMSIIRNGSPVRLGVYGIIEEWYKERRKQLSKAYTNRLEDLKVVSKKCRAFITVLSDEEKKERIIDLATHVSEEEAIKYVLQEFPDVVDDYTLAKWVVTRRLPEYRKGGKYAEELEKYTNEITMYENWLADLDKAIVDQLKALKVKHGSKYPRKTEITSTDYDFSASNQEATVEVDNTECIYVFRDGFLKKMRDLGVYVEKDGELVIKASASDTLIGFDNRGRILRVYCDTLPYSGSNELGVYLPRYFGVEDDSDYHVKYLWKLDGSTKLLTYSDGNVGFLDTSEWVGLQRQLKVVEKGISPKSDLIMAVDDVPDCLVALDEQGRIAWQPLTEIKRKDRTARTRVFNTVNDTPISFIACLSNVEIMTFFNDVSAYANRKLKPLASKDDIKGDLSRFKADC